MSTGWVYLRRRVRRKKERERERERGREGREWKEEIPRKGGDRGAARE